MANRQDWLIKLEALKPGEAMSVYPRDGLDSVDAEAAMRSMGYNMRYYWVGLHGNRLIVRRWENVKGDKPQPDQPQFAPRVG